MKRSIRYVKNKHQAEFHSDLTTKLLHLSTGFGGGKSHAAVMKMFQLSMANPNVAGGLLCPTYAEFKKDMLPLLDMICEESRIPYTYHQTDHYFKFPWHKGRVYVASGEQKLRGPNWGWCVINEVTLIPLLRYREALGRVRDKRSRISQIASVGTPEGTGSEYYEFFIEKPPTDHRLSTRVIYGDTRDNADNLDPSYIPMLEASYDKTMLDAYLKGLWVNMNGNRFYYAHSERSEDRAIIHNENEQVHAFMDFNVQYMTATFWHFDGVELFGFDEIVIENNADTQRMCDIMRERGYTNDRTLVYPDPAGKARKTTGQPDHVVLRNNGYELRVKSVSPLMRQRQLNTNNLLDKNRIHYNPDRMPTLRKDLQSVEQDPITFEKVKKNPKLTHASDGFDYGCDILFPFSGKRQLSQVVNFR